MQNETAASPDSIFSPLRSLCSRAYNLLGELRRSPIGLVESPPQNFSFADIVSSQIFISLSVNIVGFILAVGGLYQLEVFDPATGLQNESILNLKNAVLTRHLIAALVLAPFWLFALTSFFAAVDIYASDSKFSDQLFIDRYARFAIGLIPYCVAHAVGHTIHPILPVLGTLASAFIVDRGLYRDAEGAELISRRATLFIFVVILLTQLPAALITRY